MSIVDITLPTICLVLRRNEFIMFTSCNFEFDTNGMANDSISSTLVNRKGLAEYAQLRTTVAANAISPKLFNRHRCSKLETAKDGYMKDFVE